MRRFTLAGILSFVVLAAAVAADSAAAPASGPVPAGTSATSVTFISTRAAFVLGTAPCAHRPCTVILRTRNRGASWVGLPAPRQRISRPYGGGLWGLRFANARRGFAFGDGLWVTTNGGASWRRGSAPARFVLDLAAVQGRELVAVGAPCAFGRTGCAGRLTVYHRALNGRTWQAVATTGPSALGESIAVHGGVVWVLAGTQLWVSTNGGRSFRSHGQPCAHSPLGLPTLTSIADAGPHSYLLCTGQGFLSHTIKHIYRTRGTHSRWIHVSQAPTPGDGGALAAGSDHGIVLATASAASWLYRSTDAGRHWGTALTFFDGGEGWADLGFTTANDGVVIHGPARVDGGSAGFPGQLLLSSDGGRTWHITPF
jgi:photosystem II stability/assembly factor-like uncharacterized protein